MSDDLVKQSIAELQDLVRCRCHDAYKGRGLHDPTCCCDYAEALKVVSDRIDELEAKLAQAVEELNFAYDTLGEINVSNYDHDDVCNLNDKSVEVVLSIKATLAELTGGKDE